MPHYFNSHAIASAVPVCLRIDAAAARRHAAPLPPLDISRHAAITPLA